jgi:hypothetical protein
MNKLLKMSPDDVDKLETIVKAGKSFIGMFKT